MQVNKTIYAFTLGCGEDDDGEYIYYPAFTFGEAYDKFINVHGDSVKRLISIENTFKSEAAFHGGTTTYRKYGNGDIVREDKWNEYDDTRKSKYSYIETEVDDTCVTRNEVTYAIEKAFELQEWKNKKALPDEVTTKWLRDLGSDLWGRGMDVVDAHDLYRDISNAQMEYVAYGWRGIDKQYRKESCDMDADLTSRPFTRFMMGE